jgi:hypothetical protein
MMVLPWVSCEIFIHCKKIHIPIFPEKQKNFLEFWIGIVFDLFA